MQVLIVSAINSVDGVSDYSKADAIVEAQQELSRLSQVKAKDGGKIGPEDAKTLVNEASWIPPLPHAAPVPRASPLPHAHAEPLTSSTLPSAPSPLPPLRPYPGHTGIVQAGVATKG